MLLAIETSCDETAVALVDLNQEFKIINQQIYSQIAKHLEYGGVVPELAAREHLKVLPKLVDRILREQKLDFSKLSAIAVTRGPGLLGCLLIGINFAKGLAAALKIPLIGVNHIEGHLLSPLINNSIKFPALGMVVSGGHTEIHLINKDFKYKLYSRTIDDAAGEAFDKSAALLGFDYPGGPALAKLADTKSKTNFKLPRVMLGQKNFSFSGLKTAISLLIKKQGDLSETLKADLAFCIQASIITELIDKLLKASKELGVETVLISGGVAANKFFRKKISETHLDVYFADPDLCTDNAAMIAHVGYLKFHNKKYMNDTDSALPTWRLEDV